MTSPGRRTHAEQVLREQRIETPSWATATPAPGSRCDMPPSPRTTSTGSAAWATTTRPSGAGELLLRPECTFLEPAVYTTDVPDWGMSFAPCVALGPPAQVVLDTGHHAPGTTIEFIVATLLRHGRLGAFDIGPARGRRAGGVLDLEDAVGRLRPIRVLRAGRGRARRR